METLAALYAAIAIIFAGAVIGHVHHDPSIAHGRSGFAVFFASLLVGLLWPVALMAMLVAFALEKGK